MRTRNRSSAKAAGRQLENDLVAVLSSRNLKADRVRLKGSKDEGDVHAELAPDCVFECKNVRTLALSQWWAETIKELDNAKATYGWIVHKRHGVSDPSEQWATTTTGQLADLLSELAYLRSEVEYQNRRLSEGTNLPQSSEHVLERKIGGNQ